MQILRQSTQVKVKIGPAVAVANGYVPVTSLSLSGADEAELFKHDASAVTDISGATFAAITSADGYYNLTLTTSHTDTCGLLDVLINDDSLILPILARFQVVEEAVYDAMFAASAVGPLLATSDGSGLTEAGGDGDHLTAINLPNQTMDITGNITGNLSGSVGSLATQAKADVNAEVVDALATDTYAEPSAVPAATSSLKDKINWMFSLLRNKRTQTATTETLLRDDGSTTTATSTKSDDGTTLTRGEWT